MAVGNLAVHTNTVRDPASLYGAAYFLCRATKQEERTLHCTALYCTALCAGSTLVGLRRNERIREDAIALITAFD